MRLASAGFARAVCRFYRPDDNGPGQHRTDFASRLQLDRSVDHVAADAKERGNGDGQCVGNVNDIDSDPQHAAGGNCAGPARGLEARPFSPTPLRLAAKRAPGRQQPERARSSNRPCVGDALNHLLLPPPSFLR
jgi:hypothetical protein